MTDKVAQNIVVKNQGETGAEKTGRRRLPYAGSSPFEESSFANDPLNWPSSICAKTKFNGDFICAPSKAVPIMAKIILAIHTPSTGRYFPSSRHGNADDGNEVINKDQNNRQHKSRALAAFFGGKTQRNSDQHQHQASGGQGQTAVEFDPIPAGKFFIGAIALVVKFAGGQLRNRNSILCRLGMGGRLMAMSVSSKVVMVYWSGVLELVSCVSPLIRCSGWSPGRQR